MVSLDQEKKSKSTCIAHLIFLFRTGTIENVHSPTKTHTWVNKLKYIHNCTN